ncbi:MAG TPA: cysteine--tRNA ligase [Candidatus Cloacimonas sp.]|nr:cysteine--tRNA ligase [Candidatus Cloacimonas sp.]HPS60821.1 cysteine--tRNA ligase [Candidatus Cloacimonas sp.]
MLIYNTQTRKKEVFEPITPGKVGIYTCGPTVYNYFHIGNARAFLFFDVVRRYFEYRGYEVTYVQNITDIDDKIIAQAIEENTVFSSIADKYTRAYLEDTAALGIKPPTYQPKATEVMDDIIAFIVALQKKGNAYEVEGDVYFATENLPSYGCLSGKKTEEQLAGARVTENPNKRNPADFTLWKKSKPGEPVWDSPWGKGRPGWHTECVVMSRKFLGETFDLHCGGIDLIFPHHENELAQAIAYSGKPLAHYWMHNGFLNVDGEKMSKSLKNFFTARDILSEYDAETIRFFFLSKHYRSPIDFSRELMEEAQRAITNFYNALAEINFAENKDNISPTVCGTAEELQNFQQDFIAAMDDDFNTAKAISVLFELNRKVKNTSFPKTDRLASAQKMVELGSVLGFFQNWETKLNKSLPDLSKALIELLLTYRKEARNNKQWNVSDKIRNDLANLGIDIKDTPNGVKWSLKETK